MLTLITAVWRVHDMTWINNYIAQIFALMINWPCSENIVLYDKHIAVNIMLQLLWPGKILHRFIDITLSITLSFTIYSLHIILRTVSRWCKCHVIRNCHAQGLPFEINRNQIDRFSGEWMSQFYMATLITKAMVLTQLRNTDLSEISYISQSVSLVCELTKHVVR